MTTQTSIPAAIQAPRIIPTTDQEIRDLPTRTTGYKTFLGRGLYVFTTPSGVKSFRFNYQDVHGANKTHTLGRFGALTYAQAVGLFDADRERLERGECVRTAQLAKRAQVLATLADEFDAWFPRYATTVTAPYAQRTRAVMMSAEMAPMRARRLVAIDTPMILKLARAVQLTRSPSFAREVVNLLEKLFAYARLEGRHKGDNPALGVVAHLTPRDSQPLRALQLEQLPLYFQDLADLARPTAWRVQRPRSTVKSTTILALTILPYISVRQSVLRFAEWKWISWDGVEGPMLVVPAFVPGTKQRTTERRADMRGKAYAAYRVPLSRQVVELLRQLQRETGAGRFLFPGYKGRGKTGEHPISEGRWLVALRRMGWSGQDATRGAITVHGFRALFATAASTRYVITRQEEHALEFQQDHKLTEGVRSRYTRDKDGSHRGLLLAQRAAMLQWWADEIDAILGRQGESLPQSRADMAAAFASREYNSQSHAMNS